MLNASAGNFSKDNLKKRIGAKIVTTHDWSCFHMAQGDWLKGNCTIKSSLASE